MDGRLLGALPAEALVTMQLSGGPRKNRNRHATHESIAVGLPSISIGLKATCRQVGQAYSGAWQKAPYMTGIDAGHAGQVWKPECSSGQLWALPDAHPDLLRGAASAYCGIPTRALLGRAAPCLQGRPKVCAHPIPALQLCLALQSLKQWSLNSQP